MNMNKVDQIKIGAVLSYLQVGLSIVVQLLYTPIMLRLLGQNEYGLYSTVSSIIAMLSVLSLGFNSSYIRYYARYKKENDDDAIHKLNGLFLIIFLIIGAVALLCGMFLSFNLHFVFKSGLTVAEYKTARILMLLLTANLAISFPMSVFQSIISAHEKYLVLKLLGMAKTVLCPVMTLPLLLMGYRSIAMVCVTLIVSVAVDTIYWLYARGKLQVRFAFRNFEKGIFKSLFIFTSFIAINMIVDQINSNLGKLLLGRFKGTTAVAVYAIGYTIYQLYMTFSSSVAGVFSPRIHHIVNATSENHLEQRERLSELFIKVGRIQFAILALISSGFCFFGRSFIDIWAGDGYAQSYYVAVLLMLSSSIALIQNLGIEIQRAQNKHKFRSVAYIGMALINIVLTSVLCRKFDVVGAALGTSISLVLMNGLVMNIYYHKKCNIDVIAFWKSILRLCVGVIPPIAFGVFAVNAFDFSSITSMLIGIVAYSGVYCLFLWMIGLNAYEKQLIIRSFQRLLKK